MSETKVYTALGLMSGTSLDGVDAAILRTDGERILGFDIVQAHPRVVPRENTRCQKYAELDRQELIHATSVALTWGFNGPIPNVVIRASGIVDRNHAIAADSIFFRYNPEIDTVSYTHLTLPTKA